MKMNISLRRPVAIAGTIVALSPSIAAFQTQHPGSISLAFTPNVTPSLKVAPLFVATSSSSATAGQGFAKPSTIVQKNERNDSMEDEEKEDKLEAEIMAMTSIQVKEKLLDLLPRMTGSAEEYHLVELYVNALEDQYAPPQTLDFLNLAMAGDWQFLFTTNQLGRPSRKLRLTELYQKVEMKGFDGVVSSNAQWALAEDEQNFDIYGQFSTTCTYKINQGARMTIGDEESHNLQIKLSKGSQVPTNPEELVGLIHRAMPTEMFDPTNLAMDTTFLDTDIRIVRFTGERHEGVRNIFMRRGAFELNPSAIKN